MPEPRLQTTKPKLLIVDDEDPTRAIYAEALRSAGYEVVQAGNGKEGLAVAERERPALVLLDVDMPVMNGWQTLERLQQRGDEASVIILTGATDVEDRVKGLGAGADDYLGKPCDMRELLARVQAVLRRRQPRPPGRAAVLTFGELKVDLANRSALRAGVPVALTRTEYTMLECFASHRGKLVTRETLLKEVWNYGPESNTRTVETHIWRLRQKLGDNAGKPRWIQTVTSGGYRMECDGPVA